MHSFADCTRLSSFASAHVSSVLLFTPYLCRGDCWSGVSVGWSFEVDITYICNERELRFYEGSFPEVDIGDHQPAKIVRGVIGGRKQIKRAVF
jgi:hypothetical protein